MRARLSGIHTAIKRLPGGGVRIYAYAVRGGPLVAKAEGRSHDDARARLEALLGSPEALRAIEEARRPVPRIQSRRYVGGLVAAYLASDHYAHLSETTKRDYGRVLAEFKAEFYDFPTDDLCGDDLVTWRDEKRAHPRAADYRVAVVGALYRWARRERITTAEPTKDISSLHRADRSAIIWTPADLAKLYAHCSPEIRRAVELACWTGLRLADLIGLTWDRVSKEAIVLQTAKSRLRRTALIPLFPATKALLKEIGRKDVGAVLLNSRGEPWTVDGFKSSFRKAKADAKITGLRFHDLRGTAATRLKLQRVDEDDIALILGWSPESVRSLLIRYVSADEVAVDMLRRITERTPGYKPADKPGRVVKIETARKSRKNNDKSP